MENEGVFSLWNGQNPEQRLPKRRSADVIPRHAGDVDLSFELLGEIHRRWCPIYYRSDEILFGKT